MSKRQTKISLKILCVVTCYLVHICYGRRLWPFCLLNYRRQLKARGPIAIFIAYLSISALEHTQKFVFSNSTAKNVFLLPRNHSFVVFYKENAVGRFFTSNFEFRWKMMKKSTEKSFFGKQLASYSTAFLRRNRKKGETNVPSRFFFYSRFCLDFLP